MHQCNHICNLDGGILLSPTEMLQILPGMIRGSSKLFHNMQTATPIYTELDDFHRAALTGKVKDLSNFTHELRWIKSPAELKLMKEAASIVCQVPPIIHSCELCF